MAMTDCATLIELAIERDLRSHFVTFLGRYQHVEFGCARSLRLDEMTLVLACTDRFLRATSALKLGVAEIAGLRDRLQDIAQRPISSPSETMIANTCFDALACILALEARLSRAADCNKAEITNRRNCTQLAANDC